MSKKIKYVKMKDNDIKKVAWDVRICPNNEVKLIAIDMLSGREWVVLKIRDGRLVRLGNISKLIGLELNDLGYIWISDIDIE